MSGTLMPLLKVSLKQTFDFRGKNKKNVSFWVPVILILIFGSLLSAIYSFLFTFMLEGENLITILYAMSGMASLLCLTTTILKVKSTLFAGNDYDLLASLPIKKSEIVFVKFISLYLAELLYSFVFVIPPLIVILCCGSSALCVIDAIILFLFIPIIPLLLAGILGIVIGFISDRFKFGNILNVLLYLCLMAGIFYMSFMMNKENATAEEMNQAFAIFNWYNPSLYLLELLPIGWGYVAFVGVHLLCLAIIIVIMALCYDYFHILLTSFKSHRKYVAKDIKQQGQFKALFKMDCKRYFTSKSYLLNTITSGIVAIIMTVVMIVSFSSIDDPEATNVLKQIAPYFSLIILWCVGIGLPTAVCINFEGKNFWMVKSLPISYKQYSYSKLLLSEIVMAPFVLIASIILIVFSEKTAINIITTLLLPQLYLIGMNCIAYYINTCTAKLNWTNEMEAVKNAKSMIIAMLIDFAYTAVVSIVLIVLGIFAGFIVGAIVAMVVVSIIAIASFVLVRKTCTSKLIALEI